jgi:vacuolar protein sorting-associated protein 35
MNYTHRIAINTVIGRELNKLLKVPIEHYNNLIGLLKLDSYSQAIRLLDRHGQRQVASALIQNAIEVDTQIESEEQLEKVCLLVFGHLARILL